jgi:hypothetical protein
MLSVGLVGLPNVGKSTLFNALVAGHAAVSNYPFTTIDGNVGRVAVPDARLDELARLLEPSESTPCFLEVIDIAGLVEGASRGEGLGNQFLGNIRNVDATAHVLRCFREADVSHVYAAVDPVRDARIVETEILLADLEVLGRAVDKRQKIWRTSPREHAAEEARLRSYLTKLEEGVPLRTLGLDREARRELASLGLITGKPLLNVANVGEHELAGDEPETVRALRRAVAEDPAARVVVVSARIEGELAQLDADERRAFASEMGIEGSGLERLVEAAFDLLDLIRFYTVVKGKLRAWEVPRGTPAARAAGSIHSDMERGFIRAQVASFVELREHGSLQELQHRGRVRSEGREYEIRDGDVVELLFSP